MEEIKIVKDKISLSELKEIAQQRFGDFVKGVVDLEQKIMAIGGQLHADEESILLQQGSKQENLWGINIFVGQPKNSWIEFDSMINIRPRQNNRSRSV
jgi:hypothetical protein